MDRLSEESPGTFRLRLRRNETALLRALVVQLRDQLEQSTDAPVVRRLFPPAYPDDAEKDAGYQVLTRDSLLERRLEALAAVEKTLGPDGSATDVDLNQEQLEGWMATLNSLRLVLGTRLDVDEVVDIDPDDPDAPLHAVYEFLGWLLSQVVDALAESL
jgi:hypothetical protein